MSGPLFLVGAGFAAEAREAAGPIRGESIYIGEFEIQCGYPLVRDLPGICFPESDPPVPSSEVEARLASAIEARDWEPLDRLFQALLKADHYLAPRLFAEGAEENAFGRFLSDFPRSSFISFNYDAFLEYGLFRSGRWSPHDGFGVKVGAELGFTADPYEVQPSTSLVVHPHGSLLVYTREFDFGPPDESGTRWMRTDDPPRFFFDPYSLGTFFHPFGRVMAGLGYNVRLPDRVVAPVPGKAVGDRGHFVSASMARAIKLVRGATQLISIGYSFSEVDKPSHDGLLTALERHSDPRLVLVCPEADEVAERLRPKAAGVEIVACPMGFSDWVGAGYPGVRAGDV